MTETTYTVRLSFQFPAWDEVPYAASYEITASNKSEAIKRARQQAGWDGHLPATGKGRATLKAELTA